MEGRNALNQPKAGGNQVGKACPERGFEEKKAAVDEEISRINKLPSNSTYATHRLRVLNKILHLLSIQRTTSQEEELELLFAEWARSIFWFTFCGSRSINCRVSKSDVHIPEGQLNLVQHV